MRPRRRACLAALGAALLAGAAARPVPLSVELKAADLASALQLAAGATPFVLSGAADGPITATVAGDYPEQVLESLCREAKLAVARAGPIRVIVPAGEVARAGAAVRGARGADVTTGRKVSFDLVRARAQNVLFLFAEVGGKRLFLPSATDAAVTISARGVSWRQAAVAVAATLGLSWNEKGDVVHLTAPGEPPDPAAAVPVAQVEVDGTPGSLDGLDPSEVKVVGLASGPARRLALVAGPRRAWIVREGDRLARGRVTSVDADGLVVETVLQDFTGATTTKARRFDLAR